MSSTGAKIFIQIESEAEQQAHLNNQRKTLRPIQGDANDKENKILTGRQHTPLDQIGRLKAVVSGNVGVLATPEYGKRKRVESAPTVSCCDSQTQTDPIENAEDVANKPITIADLTDECEPGENYYKRLAEKRRIILEETLNENQHLHERIEGLEQELGTIRQELQETHDLVDVLKEIIDSQDEHQEAQEAKSQSGDETSSSDNDIIGHH